MFEFVLSFPVLISIYQNVNVEIEILSSTCRLSINIDILECKYKISSKASITKECINIDILECKQIRKRKNDC